MLRVEDVDAVAAAVAATGGRVCTPPQTHPFGERQARVVDPWGVTWALSETVADVDPADWGGKLVEP